MSAQPEVWRVSTPEGTFESDLDTLKQWISEGCVISTDKVSKGNLNWIEAGRVPQLRSAFNGDATPVAKPTSKSFEAFQESSSAFNNPPSYETQAPAFETARATPVPTTNVCHNHADENADYVCRMCGAVFCKSCTKFVGGKVPVCPLCGDLCRELRAVVEKAARAEFQSSGFGMADFVRAIFYPFQHKFALFSGAVLYGFLLLLGIRASVLGWMIMFACITHVISQVAWGRLNRSFMPDFSSSSFWEDRLVNVALGLGITIVSWGPVIVLMLALIFGVLNSGVASPSFASADHAEEFSSEDFAVLTDPEADPAKLEAANRKLQGLRPGAQIAREAEASKAEASDPAGFLVDFLPYLGAGTLVVLLFLLFILWGVFYYPMALTVAGYTQSFAAVINPLVGLDTIRRMGVTYFKAFAMVMVVQVVSFVISAVIYIMTSAFALPFIGDLVGNFINATFTFYFNLVIACILGLSLFKCADRLDIAVD